MVIINKNIIKFSISKNISNEPFRPISRPFAQQLGKLDKVRWGDANLALCNTAKTTNSKSHTQQKMISIKQFPGKVRQNLEAKMSGSCPSKLDGREILPLLSGIQP